jgi:hypothetical protein
MTVVSDLKTACEFVEKAAESLREAAKETYLPSEAMRQCVREEIVRIRLKLMLLRRDLTLVHDTANRRKPRGSGKTSAAVTNSDQDSKRNRS